MSADWDDVPCKQLDPEEFFPVAQQGRGGRDRLRRQADAVIAISCAVCPLHRDCFDGALQRQEPWGIWGGRIFDNGRPIPELRVPENHVGQLPPEIANTGITYRQLDFWARKGHLRPEGGEGYGKPRRWPDRELRVAALMHRLVAAGLSVNVAATAARDAVETGADSVELPSGLRLGIPRTGAA